MPLSTGIIGKNLEPNASNASESVRPISAATMPTTAGRRSASRTTEDLVATPWILNTRPSIGAPVRGSGWYVTV